MPERDKATQPFHDILSAFGLLTRLPLPQTNNHRPDAAWSWPLTGLAVGCLSLLPATLLVQAGLTSGAAAAVLLIMSLFSTGALHEDGLADTADGLFGGWTKERRLEIMKDSHIGSYGTLALIAVCLVLWSSYETLLLQQDWAPILAAFVLSRAYMALVSSALPNARNSGLSSSVGRPSKFAALVAILLSCLISFALLQDALRLFWMLLGSSALVVALAVTATRKIGGQTGDILGATQQLALVGAVLAAQI